MVASTGLATPLRLSSCTIQTPLTSRVKIELGTVSIIVLSDDSNMSLPQEAMPSRTRSRNLLPLHAPNKSPQGSSTNQTLLHPDLKQQSSIVECLRKLRASKGSKNVLKRLDYNIVKHLKVDYLLLVFNGDVV
jgi:hypothetical protein